VSLKFDIPKEWTLTRLIHDRLIKEIEEKLFTYH